MMKPDELNQLVEGAYKFGPFFFSVLFCIFLTRWAYGRYREGVVSSPPLPVADQKIHRSLFLTTFLFGIGLVIVSVARWWIFSPGVFVFKGTIERLQPQEDLGATDDVIYMRPQKLNPLKNDDPTLGYITNEHFIVTQEKPFRAGQRWHVDFEKGDQRHHPMTIEYVAQDAEPIYAVHYDSDKDAYDLTLTNGSMDHSMALTAPTAVYAASSQKASGPAPRRVAPSTYDKNLVATLQDPRSTAAEKLNAIDSLNAQPSVILRQYLELPAPAEPFALTLLDLSQHSDQELATKTARCAKRMDIDGFLAGLLVSSNQAVRESVEKVLLRIPKEHAEAILRLAPSGRFPDVDITFQRVDAGRDTLVLKPTETASGDFYFVRISWNPANASQVSCLTDYFSRTLVPKKSLQDEAVMMKNRTWRLLDWNDKNAVVLAVTETRKCGASAIGVYAQGQ